MKLNLARPFLIITIFSFVFINENNPLRAESKSTTLFFDDFEETISNDATFANWTTENIEGWQHWHIFPGQHMRFENNDLDQNDWLITKKINHYGLKVP